MQKNIAAIVLAGGQDELARANKVASKALIPIRNKTMAQYVLESLQASKLTSKITFVGSASENLNAFFDQLVTPGKDLADSLKRGIHSSESFNPEQFFIITSDLPWVSQEAIDDFLRNAPDADLVYVGIKEETTATQFPNQKRTFVRLKEGRFTGGNVMLLKPKAEKQLIPFINKAYAARKNPLRLAQIVGFRTIMGIIFGQLKLTQLEQRVSQLLGLSVRVYTSNYASLGADIDKLEHLEEASDYFTSKPNKSRRS